MDDPIELRITDHLSAIFDASRGEGIVLDEKRGRYWHVSGSALRVLVALHQVKPATLDALSQVADMAIDDVTDTLNLLLDNKLICRMEPSKPAPNLPCPQSNTVRPVVKFAPQEQHTYPRLSMVIEYAFLVPYWKLRLRFVGWRPIRCILLRQQPAPPSHPCVMPEPMQVSEEILSAIRIACIFPWVRRTCIPNSLTLYGMLKRRGYSPRLRIGADVVPFEPHMWVELEGYRIDSGADEQSLPIFQPILFVLDSVDILEKPH